MVVVKIKTVLLGNVLHFDDGTPQRTLIHRIGKVSDRKVGAQVFLGVISSQVLSLTRDKRC